MENLIKKEIPMPYNPIEIDRKNLTIMGVNFSSVNNFEAAVNALGTVMFEGFDPTPKGIEIIRDYLSDKITLGQLVQLTKDKAYA
jgi:putative transcriptional regulator